MEIKKRSCVVGLILIWFLLFVTISNHVPPTFRGVTRPTSPHAPKYQGSQPPPHGNPNKLSYESLNKGAAACGNNCGGRYDVGGRK
ncbi:hypothetical protein M8C21_013362, partial [Ambrosia artemisiifolia]